jgi:hypothetical protein
VSGVYVYCIGGAELPELVGHVGLGGALVRAVREDAITALTSEAPADVAAQGPLPTRAHLLAHDFAIAAVARHHGVLPVAFGTVLRTAGDVRALLRAVAEPATRLLAELGDRVEVGVQALCTRRNPSAARAAAEAAYETLSALADAARPLAPIGDRMMLHAAFLVPRARVGALAEAARACCAADGAPLALRVTPPRAPFHFARLALRVEPARA